MSVAKASYKPKGKGKAKKEMEDMKKK